jgi:hypothetical protein
MRYIVLSFTALASSFAHAASIAPPLTVPEPEMWALLGIAGVAAAAVKYFKK